MPIDRNQYYARVRPLFGGAFTQKQVDGMNAILDEWEARMPNGDPRWLAYMLATAFHETARTMQPVREAYWLSEAWRRANLRYYPYYGRGYVQLTWKKNYERAGAHVGANLASNPDLALRPDYAAAIMFVGMEQGWFRRDSHGPHSLPRYFSGTADNPVAAREIINGKEYKTENGRKVLLATIIARYHQTFLNALSGRAVAMPEAAIVGDVPAAIDETDEPIDIVDIPYVFAEEEFEFDAPAAEPADGQPAAPMYHVEPLPLADLDALAPTLNRLSEEGWTLKETIQHKKIIYLVMTGGLLDATESEFDDSIDPAFTGELSALLSDPHSGAAAVAAMAGAESDEAFDKAAFEEFFTGLNATHFTYDEFLVLGGQHFSGPCKGKNTYPPKALWDNVAPTVRVLDVLRERLGASINTTSVYRSPPYNACIPGAAGGSMHMQFRAVDFKCADGHGPVHWARELKALRDSGIFKGGIGVYNTFVHVDTRGYNAQFGPLKSRVF